MIMQKKAITPKLPANVRYSKLKALRKPISYEKKKTQNCLAGIFFYGMYNILIKTSGTITIK